MARRQRKSSFQFPRAFRRLSMERLEERLAPASLSIPGNLSAFQGGVVAVPVYVNQLSDASGNIGVSKADIAINYDPTVFSVATSDIYLGSLPTNASQTPAATATVPASIQWSLSNLSVNQTTGQLFATVSTSVPLNVPGVLDDSLISINFHAKSTAALGSSAINLTASNSLGVTDLFAANNTANKYTLSPSPTNAANDANVDSSVNIVATGPALGSFQSVTDVPTSYATNGLGQMLLLTDGTVLVAGGGTTNKWSLLKPDSSGNYADGTWSQVDPMSLPRLYYGSVVLQDGRLLILGGEYSGSPSANNDAGSGEIFNPSAPAGSQWTSITPIPTTDGLFGDGTLELMSDGSVLAGWLNGSQTWRYTPSADVPGGTPWQKDAVMLYGDAAAEETWVKLGDGSILTYEIQGAPDGTGAGGPQTGQRFIPATGPGATPASDQWVPAGVVPVPLGSTGGNSTVVQEIGPAFLLPDGRAFFVGASGNTALYSLPTTAGSQGTWAAGPVIPNGQGALDAPGAIMPNGDVLFAAANIPMSGTKPQNFGVNTQLYEFNPTSNTITLVPLNQANGTVLTNLSNNLTSGPDYNLRMLVLPNGQVLVNDSSGRLSVYTPKGSPQAAWQPVVTGITDDGNSTYTLTGSQLTGISEGASYGDDAQQATNYPIVELTDGSGVTFAKTTNWSTAGVATGTTPQSVQFALPSGKHVTDYTSLKVVANGIASAPVYNGFGTAVSLGEYSDRGPSIASVNGQTYVAWGGRSNNQLNVMAVNADGTANESQHYISSATLSGSPSLASLNGQLYIAWTGQDGHLYVSTVNTSGGISVPTPVQLSETSNQSPSLAAVNGKLYISWAGQGQRYLNVMQLNSNLTGVEPHYVSGATVAGSPSLAAMGGQLYVAWTGDTQSLYVSTVNTTGTISVPAPVQLSETSGYSPALGSLNGQLMISWTGQGGNALNIMSLNSDLTGNEPHPVSGYTANGSPSLGSVTGGLWLAHNGTDSQGTLYDIPVGVLPLTPAIASTSTGLTVDGGTANDVVSIGTSSNGGVEVQINGKKADFDSGGIPAIDVYLSGGTNTVNINAIPANIPVTIYAGAGTNTITVTPPGGSIGNLLSNVNVVGLGTTDLIVDDSLDPAGETYTVTNSTVKTATSPTITYSNLHSITLKAGAHADVVNVLSTAAGTTTTVSGGGGADLIHVGTTTTSSLLNTIAGPLIIQGNNSATLTADDSADTVGETGTLSSTLLSGLGMGGSIAYSALAAMNVYLGTGSDSFTISGTAVGTTTLVTAGLGSDTINVRAVGGATTVQTGGGGTDQVNVGSLEPATGGIVDGIAAPLTLTGSGGNQILRVDDTGSTIAKTGTLTQSSLTGLGMANGIAYSGFEAVSVSLGSGGNHFTIASTIAGSTEVTAGTGNDAIQVQSTGGDTFVKGGDGNDTITIGGSSPATARTAHPFAGALIIDGGSGVNQVAVTADTDFTLSDSALTLSNGDSYTLRSIQQAVLTGGPSDNRFDVSGFTGAATLIGGGGIDTVVSTIPVNATLTDALLTRSSGGSASLSGITRATLTATSTGNHVIDGSGFSGRITAYAGSGNDTITGGSGDDNIVGGSGTDTISGGPGNDIIYGGTGTGTTIDGGSGDDTLYGSTGGGDTITGDAGDDRIYGQGANNILDGGAGNDTIYGGTGGDVISGEAGSDILIGGPGASTIYGNNAADSADDHSVDHLYGHYGTIGVTTPGVAHLYGQGGNDVIAAGSGDVVSTTSGTNPFVDSGTSSGPDPLNLVAPPVITAAVIPGTPGNTLPAGVAVSGRWTDLDGAAGPAGVSGGTGQAIEPSIAATSSASYTAWADSRSGSYQIYVAKNSGSVWSELAASASGNGVSNVPSGSSRRPSITTAANAQPVVAWTQFTGTSSDIEVAQFDPTANAGRGGWIGLGGSLLAGGVSGTGAADDAVLLNTSAGLVVTWLDRSSGGVANVYSKTFNGTSWVASASGSASGLGVSGASGGVLDLAATTDGTKVAVGWTLQVSGQRQFYLKELSGGSFNQLAGSASGTGISSATGAKQAPTLAYLSGKLYAAWQNTVGSAQEIYAALYNGTAWVAAGTNALTGGGVSNSGDSATQPKLASGGGQLYLSWINDRLAGQPGDTSDVFAKQWNGTAFVEDVRGDASYRGVSQNAVSANSPALSVDATGQPILGWVDSSDGNSTVRVRAGNPSPGTVYYVNDGVTPDSSFTTSPSSAANDGLSAATPLPSISAVLAAHTLHSGDTILVDGGTYSGPIALPAADSGIVIEGSPNYPTVFSGAVSLTGASGVVFQNVVLAGGFSATGGGVTLTGDSVSGGVTLSGTTGSTLDRVNVTGSITVSGTSSSVSIIGIAQSGGGITVTGPTTGLSLRNSSTGAVSLTAASSGAITGNTIRTTGTALNIGATFTGTITANDLAGGSVGVVYAASASLFGNRIHDNTTGVISTVAGSSAGLGFVGPAVPNQIYDNTTGLQLTGQVQNQHIFNNTTGVTGTGVLGGTDLNLASVIEANTTGVNFSGPIQYTRIARGTTGVVAASNQIIDHVIFDQVGTTSLVVNGVANLQIINDTFYSPTASHIVVSGGSTNVEVRNDILWTDAGTDLSVADDSRVGFFSDYNTLYSTGSGVLVHWDLDFSDILDWQVAIGVDDSHSEGRTVVNPTSAQPRFINKDGADYRIFDVVAGLRTTSLSIDSGDPRTDLGVPVGMNTNLLTNPSFENGLTGWTTQPGASTGGGTPPAFDGSNYFIAGNTSVGFAQQTVNLITAGYTASQIDGGSLVLLYGGRVRSAAETKPDASTIYITFLDGSGNTLGSTSSAGSNVSDRWELIGDRVVIPAGTRQITYRYESVLNSGSTNDGHLDGAFLDLVAATSAPNQGAWGETSNQAAQSTATHIDLRSPDLYVDWSRDQPHTISWQTYGNSANLLVRIDLLQDTANGPVLLQNITPGTADTGSYAWTPSTSGINYGTYGLRIQISLVGEGVVSDRSQESFTVPENGHSYYVNDSSTTGDQYSTAPGSNRNTGRIPTGPKPDANTILKLYTLGAGNTLYVDNGTYPLFSPVLISGTVGVGDDQGFTLTGPTNAGTKATLQFADPLTVAPLIELTASAYTTVENLSLTGAQYGLYATNHSTNLLLKNLNATANSIDGIHVDTGSDGTALENVTAIGNLHDGAYLASLIDHVTGSTFNLNHNYGVDLENPGSVRFQSSTVSSNVGTGLLIYGGSSSFLIGATDLTLNAGNIVTGNGGNGIQASGTGTVAGNEVSGQAAYNTSGIYVSGGASAIDNISFNNYNGITGDSGSALTGNRTYHNSNIGINAPNGGTATGNVSYSNSIGATIGSNGIFNNNLLYANSSEGLVVDYSYVTARNNTIYQTAGDAVNVLTGITGLTLRDNILWVTSGYDIDVPASSQTGFASDYNLLYATGSGQVGDWQGGSRLNLSAWQNATLGDGNSIFIDPQFVSPSGADGILAPVPHRTGPTTTSMCNRRSIASKRPVPPRLQAPRPDFLTSRRWLFPRTRINHRPSIAAVPRTAQPPSRPPMAALSIWDGMAAPPSHRSAPRNTCW